MEKTYSHERTKAVISVDISPTGGGPVGKDVAEENVSPTWKRSSYEVLSIIPGSNPSRGNVFSQNHKNR